MIHISLTPEQIRAARRGEITLTPEQAASVRGQVNARSRMVILSCTCGECRTCKARERKRLQRSNAR